MRLFRIKRRERFVQSRHTAAILWPAYSSCKNGSSSSSSSNLEMKWQEEVKHVWRSLHIVQYFWLPLDSSGNNVGNSIKHVDRLPRACYMSRLFHPSSFLYRNNIKVQIVNLYVTQFLHPPVASPLHLGPQYFVLKLRSSLMIWNRKRMGHTDHAWGRNKFGWAIDGATVGLSRCSSLASYF